MRYNDAQGVLTLERTKHMINDKTRGEPCRTAPDTIASAASLKPLGKTQDTQSVWSSLPSVTPTSHHRHYRHHNHHIAVIIIVSIIPEILGDEDVRCQTLLGLANHPRTLGVAAERRLGHIFGALLVVVGRDPGRWKGGGRCHDRVHQVSQGEVTRYEVGVT